MCDDDNEGIIPVAWNGENSEHWLLMDQRERERYNWNSRKIEKLKVEWLLGYHWN